MISYAQAREDVLLHRALHRVPFSEGFYIDVGGFDPTHDSVTKHFYDHGWRGVNVEPGMDLFPAFVRDRPRDINLQVAVTDHPGEATFHGVEGQLGTLESRFAKRHVESGLMSRSYTVPAMTLAQICEEHAPTEIHFLKIDIEGHEGAAIRGMDFCRFRPWVLVIEATEPNNMSAPTYGEWDPTVCAAGYRMVYTDVLNRYYVANEHADLIQYFTNPADDYHYGYVIKELHQLRGRVAELEARFGR
ncbi:MAG TPA: FkbM family methyltransferase [Sphingomonas sp.]|jgi:FkbM family methyltransferase|uniref:FkbM family methyltransferase n=1 Tax=Sphingomonas sp. TaxID=28214 RepID=UPI002ED85A35